MSSADLPDGYRVPVFRALSEPILLAGAPRLVTILNGTFAAALGLGLRVWLPALILWLVLQGAAAWATRKDRDFLSVLARHVRYPGYFSC